MLRQFVLLLSVLSFTTNTFGLPTVEQVDPGRTMEEIQQQLPEETEPLPKIKLPKTQNAINEDLDSSKVKFTLKGVKFKGNTIFKDSELKAVYKSYLGKKQSLKGIRELAAKVASYYRDKGYILTVVLIPPQEINERGVLTLEIVEGYISKIIIEGNTSSEVTKLLQGYGRQIQKSKPLTMRNLERYSLLANEIPGVNVKVLVSKGTSHGASNLTFIVEEKRISAFISGNNFNSELLGRNQFIAGIDVNNLLLGSETAVRGLVGTPPKRLNYASFHHKQMLNYDSLQWDVNFSYTKTEPDFVGLNSTFLSTPGEAGTFTTNLTYTYIRSRVRNLRMVAGFTYMNSHTDALDTVLFKDWIRSISLKTLYDWRGSYRSTNQIIFKVYQGLKILGAKAEPPSRPGGRNDFTKITFDADRHQPLGNLFGLALYFASQYSFSELLSFEKFGYGAGPFGYGYDPSEITGDHGIAGKFELQFNPRVSSYPLSRIQLFTNIDEGVVWNKNSTFQVARAARTSASFGARILPRRRFSAEFFISKPFRNLTTTNNKDIRVYFNVLLLA